jgi:hypothetical protein
VCHRVTFFPTVSVIKHAEGLNPKFLLALRTCQQSRSQTGVAVATQHVKCPLGRLGVLEKVPIGTPDTCMVIVGKANGEPQRVVDYQPLNAHATREMHHTKSPYHQACSVPKMMKKSVFDAWNGYHSVPLHPDDTHFTTFITPWGRYRYLTAPRGTKHRVMDTVPDLTGLSRACTTRPNAWMRRHDLSGL